MDIFAQIAERIIKEQEGIIGPIALEEASHVSGIKVDTEHHTVHLEGDPKETIEKLIEQYRDFFGQASVNVCKDAVKGIINKVPQDQLPDLLR